MSEEKENSVARRRSRIFWLLLVAISILVLFSFADVVSLIVWLSVSAVIVAITTIFRVLIFKSRTNELLKTGQSLRPYDYRKQTRGLVVVLMLTMISFLAPLLLSGSLVVDIWLGGLIGVMDGWLLHLISYNTYLSSWEKRKKGKLYSIQKWSGNRVTDSGLSFEKEAK